MVSTTAEHYQTLPTTVPTIDHVSVNYIYFTAPLFLFKGTFNSFGIKFLAFVTFPFFVNDTFMCPCLRQEIKQKITFQVDRNIFILEPEPNLYKRKRRIFHLRAPVVLFVP